MADDFGYECVTANGGESYKTPHLDNLAATGIRFNHCYAQPICTPSRVKIMTGIYNVKNYEKFGLLPRDQTTFAHLLKKNGYATCIAGKWQLGKEKDSPQHFGFDESCLWQHTRGRSNEQKLDTRFENPRLEVNGEPVDYKNGEFGPSITSDYLCDFMERNQEKPFFVYYPLILTHCPFIPTPDSPDYDAKSMGSKTYKGDAKYFGGMVHYLDKVVKKLTDKLDQLGLRENTLFIFTGDNGTDTPVVSMFKGQEYAGAKGKTINAGHHVPLIVNWPGTIQPGQETDALVDFSDFLPTLCETTGTETPSNIDGKSFLPVLKGETSSVRDWIYCWYSRTGKRNQASVFTRDQRYKLYENGKFYDIQNDLLEKKPLDKEAIDTEARQSYKKLSKALKQYRPFL
jgi:arylsulfatase A